MEAGVDLRTIQTLLGHNSMASTERYLQIRQHKITTTANPLDLLKVLANFKLKLEEIETQADTRRMEVLKTKGDLLLRVSLYPGVGGSFF